MADEKVVKRVDGASGHIDDLNEKQPYAVHFDAEGTNTGTTSVAIGWVPQPQTPQASLPPAVIKQVTPNGFCDHQDAVPAVTIADRLQIKVQKPGNKGELSVTQGNTTWIGKVTADVTWTFDVD